MLKDLFGTLEHVYFKNIVNFFFHFGGYSIPSVLLFICDLQVSGLYSL